MNNTITDIVAGSFVLAEVEVRSKSFTKKDAKATAETIANNHAVADAGKFEKNLLAGSNAELKAVQKAGAACRTYLYQHTTPYSTGSGSLQKGARLLPSTKAMDFMAGFGALEIAYNNALTDFKAVYDQRRLSALTALGNMANPMDYPDSAELDKFFGVTLHINPVPASKQLPDSLPTEVLEAAASNLAETQVNSINNAIADTRERLGEELVRMAGVFTRHAKGEKTKLYGSLLDNMRTVTDLLEATNVTNDPVLASVVTEVRDSLVPKGRDIDAYKLSKTLCEDAAGNAAALATKLNTVGIAKVKDTTEVVETPAPSLPAEPEPELTPESVQEQFNREFAVETPAPATPVIPDLDEMF